MKTRSTLPAGLLMPALLVAAGCPEHIGELTRAVTHWDVTMGPRGGDGFVVFNARSDQNGNQSGECRDAACQASVDDLAVLRLTPVPGAGFRFRFWEGDAAHSLFCPAAPGQDGTISWTVSATAVCIAVFEAAPLTPTTPTTPGG